MKKVFQIQISLKGVKPRVWRRVLVPSDVLLSDFHRIIQMSMGWTDTHLHQFYIKGLLYGSPMEDDLDDFGVEDYTGLKLNAFLKKEKDKLQYDYDFGDNWEHTVVLEKILPFDDKLQYPVCVAGRMSCPPEDCGGAWGYMDMLEVLKQPEHEEYKSYMEWMGGPFDPKEFDKGLVNKALRGAF
ncbi:plasmid pRiA4b ORF-3 family protein [Geofilum rhodophaeum]|uniref:plasmid pRiA4b ORF-3 family protein n=1 Tax=Geofilum rhodophaeum TaxID=1965019 RepID=UPI000B528858|nr:plasmid pRiA4b ORF-3 family protein [Geofilum rhodophaeum]